MNKIRLSSCIVLLLLLFSTPAMVAKLVNCVVDLDRDLLTAGTAQTAVIRVNDL